MCNSVPAGGPGIAPRVTPGESTSWSKVAGTAHCRIMQSVSNPATGSAHNAESARHAMNTVAAIRIVKIIRAGTAWTLATTRRVAASK